MNNELIAKLRNPGLGGAIGAMSAAADEIERLEALLVTAEQRRAEAHELSVEVMRVANMDKAPKPVVKVERHVSTLSGRPYWSVYKPGDIFTETYGARSDAINAAEDLAEEYGATVETYDEEEVPKPVVKVKRHHDTLSGFHCWAVHNADGSHLNSYYARADAMEVAEELAMARGATVEICGEEDKPRAVLEG